MVVAGILNIYDQRYVAYELNKGGNPINEIELPNIHSQEELQVYCDMSGAKIVPTKEIQQHSFTWMCDHMDGYLHDIQPNMTNAKSIQVGKMTQPQGYPQCLQQKT